MSPTAVTIALRSSAGLDLVEHKNTDSSCSSLSQSTFEDHSTKSIHTVQFDSTGTSCAYSTSTQVVVLQCVENANTTDKKWQPLTKLHMSNASKISFSPLSTHLVTFKQFGLIEKNVGVSVKHNVNIWKIDRTSVSESGEHSCPELVAKFISKKDDTTNLIVGGVQWTQNERFCLAKADNNEIHVFQSHNFSKAVKRIRMPKLNSFYLSTECLNSQFIVGVSSAPLNILCFAGSPQSATLRLYSDALHIDETTSTFTTRTVFNVDTLDVKWNSGDSLKSQPKGSLALILAECSVDATGGSYYGKNQLYLMSSGEGRESYLVQCGKEGPIYSTAWSPQDNTFVVVYGFMPSEGALFDSKCNKLFTFNKILSSTEIPPKFYWNQVLFNGPGNIVMLAGFGNISGGAVHLFYKTRSIGNEWISLADFKSPNTTSVKFTSDGRMLVTSTCAPRLRQDNGFQIFNFWGEKLLEKRYNEKEGEFLYQLEWCLENSEAVSWPNFEIARSEINEKRAASRKSNVTSDAYVPPSVRILNTLATLEFGCRKSKTPVGLADAPPSTKELTKSQIKNMKRREKNSSVTKSTKSTTSNNDGSTHEPPNGKGCYNGEDKVTLEKRLKSVRKTLQAINSLKQAKQSGKTLEQTQLDKIGREEDILLEIQGLLNTLSLI